MRTLPLRRCWAICFERVRRFRSGFGTCQQPQTVPELTGYAERILKLVAGHRFYAIGVFGEKLRDQTCIAVDPGPRSAISRLAHRVGVGFGTRRRPLSLTSSDESLYGAVEISEQGLLVRVWMDQWLEAYGYVISRTGLSSERLLAEIKRLDEHEEFLVCRDYAIATDIARMLDNQDNSVLYVHGVSSEFANPETVFLARSDKTAS